MKSQLPGRLTAEFVVIVLGVLVALAVDDWRAGQADRAREAYFIVSLREDLRADVADFQAAWRNGQARMAAASYITQELGARTPRAEGRQGLEAVNSFTPHPDAALPTDLTAAMQQIAVVANFDFSDGTHQEILSTASFAVMRSEELRRGISTYYAFAANRTEADNRVREALFQYYEALRNVGLAPGDDGELLRDLPDESLHQLLATVRLCWGLAANQSRIATDLEAAAEDLLGLLEQHAVSP